MSRRIIFLSGGLVAIIAVVGAMLVSQLWFNQPTNIQTSAVNAQPMANAPSFGANGANPQVVPTVPPSTVSVQGVGRATAAPDIARITIGVESTGPNVGKAVTEVNTKQKAIIAKLLALGVAEKDIQTTNFSVNIDRSKPLPSGADGPVAYHVNNTAQITVRKPDQLAAVIDAAVSAGANNIYGVNLSLSDSTTVMGEARAKAVADARAKAEALAKAAGVKLGRVISISEGFVGGPQPVFGDARAQSAGPIETGELQVSAQVQIVFAIEQ